jgi:acyl-CoA hydrolase
MRDGEVIPVTEASVVYVAIDKNGKPTPIALLKKEQCGTCRHPKTNSRRKGSRKSSRTSSHIIREG